MKESNNEFNVEAWPIEKLIGYANNPRKNDHAVDSMAANIKEFGFRVPIVAKSDGVIVDGHLRLKAAKKLDLKKVPVMIADDLSDAQVKAFRLAVNRAAELAEWDMDLLKIEIEELDNMQFDVDLLGFENLDELIHENGNDDFEFNPPSEKSFDEKMELKVLFEDANKKDELFLELRNRGFEVKLA